MVASAHPMPVDRARQPLLHKRILVCGKGGSGKSTVVALIAAVFRERGKFVLAFDSDESNACLHWMLGKFPFRREFVRSALQGTPITKSPVAAEVQSIADSILFALQTRTA